MQDVKSLSMGGGERRGLSPTDCRLSYSSFQETPTTISSWINSHGQGLVVGKVHDLRWSACVEVGTLPINLGPSMEAYQKEVSFTSCGVF
jgi:hypothetical protein